MDSLAIPSQAPRRQPHSRQKSSLGPSDLRLPTLPRFHPANFGSQNSSAVATPVTGPTTPQGPLSPKAKYHAQMQFALYQNQIKGRGGHAKPTSPRLAPLGSPGPVTPLELAEDGVDGYLTAGIRGKDAASHVDQLIREEAARRGEISPGRAATSVGGR